MLDFNYQNLFSCIFIGAVIGHYIPSEKGMLILVIYISIWCLLGLLDSFMEKRKNSIKSKRESERFYYQNQIQKFLYNNLPQPSYIPRFKDGKIEWFKIDDEKAGEV